MVSSTSFIFMNNHDFYTSVSPQIITIDDASIAVRVYGSGPSLVLIHGFFVYGYTWHKILPTLAQHFTCYVVDLPGFGDSVYTTKTDFSFTAQAARINKLLQSLNIHQACRIIAHDTGASIARLVALDTDNGIEKLILINTEIPYHRPPFIPMYQWLAKLPLANLTFRTLLKSDFIVRSPMLLNQFFYNKAELKNKNNLRHYVAPLKKSKNMQGMLGYLRGIEWDVVDNFAKNHPLITAKTLLVWGEEDKTFPVGKAEQMQQQFKATCQFTRIKRACLMPHEERPQQVLDAILPFLK